ncbi:major facilitator superfamily domain-containing protein [Kalaharituber pfeilii]|nr:major facilitator superfamily domain-containing protein [Kalaharituber pfeilii]
MTEQLPSHVLAAVQVKAGELEKQVNAVTNAVDDSNIIRDLPTVMTGWRLRISIFGLSLSLLLSALETTIVATALISISEAFNTYDRSGWIVVSYMLTYTGFQIVFAKLSDIWGKKNMMLLAIAVFVGFSLACGFAKGFTELIVYRAFQGMGASGIYSMVSVIVPAIVSIREVPKYMMVISGVYVLSSVLGPVVGGAITDKADWRWVFWLNGPAGAVPFLVLLFSLPVEHENTAEPNPPFEAMKLGDGKANNAKTRRRFLPAVDVKRLFTRQSLERLDVIGVVLSLGFSILLVFILQEGGIDYPWSSASIIVPLVVSILCFILFVAWEEYIVGDRRKHLPAGIRNLSICPTSNCEAIFPLRLVKRRVSASLLATGFLTGFPFMTALFNLPQRFQTVNQLSATAAGIRLFPLLLSSTFATAATGILIKIVGKGSTHIVWYLTVLGTGLQLIGTTLLGAALGAAKDVQPQQYVYQTILGLGIGFVLSALLIGCRIEVDQADLAVVMGAITQVRTLGGCIGLAVNTALMHHELVSNLAGAFTETELAGLLKSTEYMWSLPEAKFEAARVVYAGGYATQMKVMIAFAGAAVMTAACAWRREWKVIEGM